MKHLFILLILLFALIKTNLYSQSIDTIGIKTNQKFIFINKLNKIDLTNIDLNKINDFKNIKQTQYFSIYNNITTLNDNLEISNIVTKQNASYMLENNFRGVKIDSFNPNGARNLRGYIFSGLFNLLIK